MEKVTKGLTNWLSSEGMTQKDVAEKLGVSEQFVNALFNGRREFGKKTANDWQKLFWLSASWLRTGEGKMLAAEIDTPKETIAEALGHSVATVTDIYIKFNRRKIDEANRRVIDAVLAQKPDGEIL